MKIVFINRFYWPDHSATSQLLTDLAVHLVKTGSLVYVVTSRQVYDNPDATLAGQDTVQGVHITRMWTTRFGRQRLPGRALDYFTFYLSAAWSLWRLLEPGDIVVAKTDPPLISVVAAVLAKLRGALLVNWIQDLFPEIAFALEVRGIQFVGGLLRQLRNLSLGAAEWNVVLGTRMAQRVIAEGVRQSAIRVIHNWADGLAIQPVDREKNDLRQKWNLQDKFVVGYSGNLGRAHEFDTILTAAELIKESENVVFLFIGGGSQVAWVAREIERRSLKNVLLKPYQPRERLMLSLGVPDVHLITLRPALEGLIVPSKFYGVAAAGRPVVYIGDKDGEVPRILQDAQCGYTVGVNCAGEAARVIRSLSVDEAECRRLGRRAREVFERHFDKAKALQSWQSVLASRIT